MSGIKRILFVTTANLSSNPRLLKELTLFHDVYQCEFLGFKLGNWTEKLEVKHHQKLPNVQFQYLSATRDPLLPWLLTTFVHMISKYISFVHFPSVRIFAFRIDKKSFLLWKFLRKHKQKYDLIIAHNLGALYPVWWISNKWNKPFIFDVEDYHPGELHCKNNPEIRSIVEFLLKKLVVDASLVTSASIPIEMQLEQLLGEGVIKNKKYISNSFNSTEFVRPERTEGKLKMVWFSQYITEKRGLELFMPVLDEFKDQIEIVLIGSLRKEFYENFLINFPFVEIWESMSQKELHIELSKFDMGLACELSEVDLNKDLALSNKLFAYVQAGLYVLATNTTGQQQFMEEYKWAGEIVKQDKESVRKSLQYIISNIDDLRKTKLIRFQNAKILGWEKEGDKLRNIVDKVLNGKIHRDESHDSKSLCI